MCGYCTEIYALAAVRWNQSSAQTWVKSTQSHIRVPMLQEAQDYGALFDGSEKPPSRSESTVWLGRAMQLSGASSAFMELIADGTPAKRWRSLRRDLLDYCERDTWAMVPLVRTLEGGKARKVSGGVKGGNATHRDGRPRRNSEPMPAWDLMTELLTSAPSARRHK